MFVLGLDPGLAKTGYAVLDHSPRGPRVVAAGAITTAAGVAMSRRLLEIHTDLCAIIAENDIAEAAIEQVFTSNNRRTAIAVGRASGVAMLAVAGAGLPLAEYTPTQVKAAVCGYGGADKAQVRKAVSRRLGLQTVGGPADVADAIAVALCHAQGMRMHRIQEQVR